MSTTPYGGFESAAAQKEALIEAITESKAKFPEFFDTPFGNLAPVAQVEIADIKRKLDSVKDIAGSFIDGYKLDLENKLEELFKTPEIIDEEIAKKRRRFGFIPQTEAPKIEEETEAEKFSRLNLQEQILFAFSSEIVKQRVFDLLNAITSKIDGSVPTFEQRFEVEQLEGQLINLKMQVEPARKEIASSQFKENRVRLNARDRLSDILTLISEIERKLESMPRDFSMLKL